MRQAFEQLKAKAKASPTFLARMLEQARREPLFPREAQGCDDNQVREPLHDRLVRWLSDVWQPLFAGEMATAADMPPQEHTFYLDEGAISVSCRWWPAIDDLPGGIWLQWRADMGQDRELWVRFTHAESTIVLAEAPLGHDLSGEVEFSAETLGFDPSREPWALALIIRE